MMLTLALRARGWDVLDLGGSVEAAHVPRTVAAFRPQLVVLHAGRAERAAALAAAAADIANEPGRPRPVVALAGAGFADAPPPPAADVVLPAGIAARLDAIERLSAPSLS